MIVTAGIQAQRVNQVGSHIIHSIWFFKIIVLSCVSLFHTFSKAEDLF